MLQHRLVPASRLQIDCAFNRGNAKNLRVHGQTRQYPDVSLGREYNRDYWTDVACFTDVEWDARHGGGEVAVRIGLVLNRVVVVLQGQQRLAYVVDREDNGAPIKA
jgi:hypothetical protein